MPKHFYLQHVGFLSHESRTRFALSVGGVGFVVTTEDPGTRFAANGATRRFVGDPGEDPLVFEIRRGDLSGPRPGHVVFEAGEWWTLRRDADDWIFDIFTVLNGPVPFRSARVRPDFSSGEIVLHAPYYRGVEEVDPLGYPLAELVLNGKLAREGGVELHACGIVDENGRGLVFAGRSGDGKTTTARLWDGRPGVTVLSDDRLILSRRANEFCVYGTPWHGEAEFAAAASAPLAALFLLEHGSATEAVPVSGAEAVANLMPRCFPPFYSREGVEGVLGTLQALVGAVPCFRFPFVPGQGAVECTRRAVEGLSP